MFAGGGQCGDEVSFPAPVHHERSQSNESHPRAQAVLGELPPQVNTTLHHSVQPSKPKCKARSLFGKHSNHLYNISPH